MRSKIKFVFDSILNKIKYQKKVPMIFQMENTECGAASLSMILAYYNKWLPLEEVREVCMVSRDGSNAYNIVSAANNFNLNTKAYTLKTERLVTKTLPAIIHWDANHFVVLTKIKKDKFFINDPALGQRKIKLEEFDKHFTGVVICFSPDSNFVSSKNVTNIFKSFYQKLVGVKTAIIYLILLGFLIVILRVFNPIVIQIFIDNIIVEGNTSLLFPLLMVFIISSLLGIILEWLKNKYLQRMATKLSIIMYSKYFWHLLRLPLKFFMVRGIGDIIFRLAKNDGIVNFLSEKSVYVFLDILAATIYLYLMFKTSIELTTASIIIIIFYTIIIKKISKKMEILNSTTVQNSSMLMNLESEGIDNIEDIKSNGLEDDFFIKWSGTFTRLINKNRKMWKLSSIANTITNTTINLLTLILLAVGTFLIFNNKITIGVLIGFQVLMGYFLEPITKLYEIISTFPLLKNDITRIDDVLNYEEDSIHKVNDNSGFTSITYSKLKGSVNFKNITFGYNKAEYPIIDDLNLDIKPGIKLAIVGKSGSGKTTLAKILTSLEKPWEGDILFDGISYTKINRNNLVNSLVYVEQKINLFEGTIKENLTLWDKNICNEDVINATKDTLIFEEIMSRPGGFNSIVEDGGRNFSGGQIQRLELARALAKKPSILILDEATSSLDAYTEKEIFKKISKRDCTIILISHRLSSVYKCDQIVVVDEGRIIQKGSHEELIQIDGLYKELVSSELLD